jgi:hypothetical protein
MTHYKGCTIVRTLTVCATDNRRLYQITGRLAKEAGRRPFLTTLRDVREWIDLEGQRDGRGTVDQQPAA